MDLQQKIVHQYKPLSNNDSVLKHIRDKSIALFEKKGFPTTKDEEWKYTNLNRVLSKNYNLSEEQAQISFDDIRSYLLNADNYRVVFVNGRLNHRLSKIPIDFSVKNLTDLDDDTLSKYLCQISYNEQEIVAINNSMINEGIYIEVPKAKTVKEPLEIIHITESDQDIMKCTRSVIVVNKNAEINIVERHCNLSDNVVFTNGVSEIFVKENANLYYYKLQNDSLKSNMVDYTFVSQQTGSNATVDTFSFGGDFTRNNLYFYLNGENATSNLNSVSMLDHKQLVDNHTTVEHRVPHCNSNEMYKGVYKGESNGVFNGKVIVYPNAQKTNGFQQNNNILLSKNARVNTKPQLEIFADDVRCSHGCTVGQIDKDTLFYLRSRGLSKSKAQALMIYAFVSEVLQNMKIEELKEYIIRIIAKKTETIFI